MKGFLKRYASEVDDAMAVDVALNACTGQAARYLGGLPFAPHNIEEFWLAIDSRYQL